MGTWIHDFGNFRMVLDTNDSDISQQIKKFGWYDDEKFETELFKTRLKPGMSVVDLGANIGFYSVLSRSLVGNDGRIFSFEPFPNNAQLIRQSIKENSYTNMFLIESAVSDYVGNSTLYLSPDACSEHSLLNLDFDHLNQSNKITVPVTTVDHYFQNNVDDFKVDFIKMDIEGSEGKALNGMKTILEENKKLSIITEFWPNGFRKDGKNPKDFLDALASLNFKLYNIDNLKQSLSPITVHEMTSLIDYYDDNVPDDKVMKRWGWYTNILCER